MAGYLSNLLKRSGHISEVLRPRPLSLYQPTVATSLSNTGMAAGPEIEAQGILASATRPQARKGRVTVPAELAPSKPHSVQTGLSIASASIRPTLAGAHTLYPSDAPVYRNETRSKVRISSPEDFSSPASKPLHADIRVPNIPPHAKAAAPAGALAARESTPEQAEILLPANPAASPRISRTPVHHQQPGEPAPAKASEPVVHITIRRVEVNAITQTAKPKTTQPKLHSVMSLDEYLEYRNMEGRK
jgi:hypothetical protein